MKILYVEDDPQDADLTRQNLPKSAPHYTLDIVGTCQEAISRLEHAGNYDLVLTDFKLPDGDGLVLLAHIRSNNLPMAVVVISGKGDEETAVAALKAGADDYIVKRKDYLLHLPLTLENALQRYQAKLNLHTHPLRVFYGEHHAADIDLTQRHLTRHAPFIQLQVATTAPEITQTLSDPNLNKNFDVILLDFSLPGLNTLDLIKEFVQERRVDLPFVLVTGQGSEEVAVQAIKLGAADYIVKVPGYLFKLPILLENAFHYTQMERDRSSLQVSEESFRFLFANNPHPMWVYDLETLAFLEVNDTAINNYGYTRHEFLQMRITDIRPAEDVSLLLESLKQERPVHQNSGEWRHKFKDGTIINVEITSHILEFNGRKASLIVAHDITARRLTELDLRTSEESFRDLVENIHDLIMTHDLEGNILSINHSAIRLSGYTADELIGKNLSFFLPPKNRPEFDSYLASVKENGIASGLMDFITKSGQRRIWEYNNTLRITGIDEPIVRGYARDITEQRQAEFALRQSENKLRSLFVSMKDVILVLDEQGCYIDIAPTSPDLLYKPPEEMLGKTLHQVFPKENADTFLGYISSALKTQQTIQFEYNLLVNEQTIWFAGTVSPLTKDSVIWIGRDITAARQAEVALRNSESKLRSLFAAMTDVIIVYNNEGRYLEIAPTDPSNLYRPPVDMLGKTVLEVMPPDIAGFIINNIVQTLQNDEPTLMDYSLVIDGQEVWFAASVSPLSPDSVIWVARDITARRQADEKINRQLEQLGTLAQIDRIISSSFNLQLNLVTILENVTRHLGVDAADILLSSPGTDILDYSTGVGFRTIGTPKKSIRTSMNFTGRANTNDNLIRISDLDEKKGGRSLLSFLASESYTSYYAVPLQAKGKIKGVLEVFNRTPLKPDQEWFDFLNTLAGQSAIAIENAQLIENLQRSNFELTIAYDATIEGWSRALDLRDHETEGHTLRVTQLTIALARSFSLSNEILTNVRWGTLLHDIGKMGIPDSILLKPGSLTDEEWVIMRKHPVYAYEMLSPISHLKQALDVPYCHHEKWDGTGYPRGLKAEQIPLIARLFAVVDVYDALTSDRPYRPAWKKDQSLAYIREQSGKHFDPKVVDAFIKEITFNDPY
jgi:PAS domain S-box-containing protein